MFGCGCWAQQQRVKQSTPGSSPSYTVGISTTGCGEHLVRTFLAKECGQNLSSSTSPLDDLQMVMKEKFAESEFLSGVPEKLGGAIAMHYDNTNAKGSFLWTHTTASMGVAYQTTADDAATTVMSRIKEPQAQPGSQKSKSTLGVFIFCSLKLIVRIFNISFQTELIF